MTWFEYIGAIRWGTKLTPRLRELAIVRIAQAAHYGYALQQHVPAIDRSSAGSALRQRMSRRPKSEPRRLVASAGVGA